MKSTSAAIVALTLISALSLNASPTAAGILAVVPVSVPDTGSSIALLGLSVVVLVALRKKFAR